MPERPRSHELETESQRAFEQALHSSMVARPVPDDYGADREVELFEGGHATGLTFKVQLKATDKSGKRIRVKREHLNYWHNLDVPVLLVTFESRTTTLRMRWVHSIGADGPDSGAKTITVKMEEQGIEYLGQPQRLIDDLRALRSMRRGEFPNPVPVAVVTDENLPWEKGALEVALLVRSRSSRRPMVMVESQTDPAMVVSLRASEFKVTLPLSHASCTVHLSSVGLPDVDVREIAELVILLCAAVAAKVNEEAALDWIELVSPNSPWWELGIAENMFHVLSSERTKLLVSTMYMSRIAAGLETPFWLEFTAHNALDSIPDETFSDLAELAERSFSADREGGRLAFNLAGAYRRRSDYAGALKCFEEAKRRNPLYKSDHVFHRSVAACSWEVGYYLDAADSYRQAVESGGDPYELLPLLADSLIFAGEYAAALDALSSWEPRGDRTDRVGALRLVALRHLCRVIGVEKQSRAGVECAKLAEAMPDEEESTGREELLEHLKVVDALSIVTWVALAASAPEEHGFEGMLIAALIAHSDPVLWVLAAAAAIEDESRGLVAEMIVDQARFGCGEGFYDFVSELPQDVFPRRAALVALVEQRFREDPEVLTQTLRLVDPGGERWVSESVEVGYHH